MGGFQGHLDEVASLLEVISIKEYRFHEKAIFLETIP